MKNLTILFAVAPLLVAAPLAAKSHKAHAAGPNAQGYTVAERDAKGVPTKVSKDGQTYTVCTSDDSDGCVNPREAGLNYGNHTARDWPGQPISRRK